MSLKPNVAIFRSKNPMHEFMQYDLDDNFHPILKREFTIGPKARYRHVSKYHIVLAERDSATTTVDHAWYTVMGPRRTPAIIADIPENERIKLINHLAQCYMEDGFDDEIPDDDEEDDDIELPM